MLLYWFDDLFLFGQDLRRIRQSHDLFIYNVKLYLNYFKDLRIIFRQCFCFHIKNNSNQTSGIKLKHAQEVF